MALDARPGMLVVGELAYWLGNRLLDNVGPNLLHDCVGERFRLRAGRLWGAMSESVPFGSGPNHAFHVFGI